MTGIRLDPGELPLIAAALEVAAADRDCRAGEQCAACLEADYQVGMCPEHLEHAERATEYRALAARLQGEGEPQ